MAVGGRIIWDDVALEELLTSTHGGVGRDLQGKGERVAQEAKRLAPVSPHGSGGRPSGWLRSHIGWTMGSDGEGLYVDVSTPAETEAGAPYGAYQLPRVRNVQNGCSAAYQARARRAALT